MSEIKPALSPEEWGDGEVWSGYLSTRTSFEVDGKGRAVVTEDRDDGTEVTVPMNTAGDSRFLHGVAALALHGQPFGFTWEDVDTLRESPPDESLLDAIADRIAALLPPREP